MRTISAVERRRRLSRRHHLAGDATGPEAAARSVLALHATDPASVYLSVLARAASTTLDDVRAAMYDRRSLVRWLGMRRTLFVVAHDDVPLVQAAASDSVATSLRTRLVNQLERNGTDPVIEGDAGRWVDALGDRVEQALRDRGHATGADLGDDVPLLRTAILPHAASDQPQYVATRLLTLLSARGRIVRAAPIGPWTTRQHAWEHVDRWWPDSLPTPDRETAERELAMRWLDRFGPATVDDLQWWTGWNKTTTRRALAGLHVEEVDLAGQPGIALPGDDAVDDDAAPVAALLPALDPTAMGWKQRDWYLGVDPGALFDRAGNIGPTVWWDGEIIGGWAVAPSGEIRTECLVDRGAAAAQAVAEQAADLQHRLSGAVVTPAARTPLERELAER